MPETLTKARIVERMHARIGLTKRASATVLDQVFELMERALESGDVVKIAGFGSFTVREKNARPGRNPRTKEPVLIARRRALVFKPSGLLRARLNAD